MCGGWFTLKVHGGFTSLFRRFFLNLTSLAKMFIVFKPGRLS